MCVLNAFDIRNVKLNLLKLNCFCFMQLVPTKQLDKFSNSVSIVQSCEGKAMLYLHLSMKYV